MCNVCYVMTVKQQQQPQQPPGVGVPAQDPNAAAWAAYYQQLYGQQQPVVMPQQSQPQQPVVMPQQQQQPQMVVQQPGATPQQGFSYPSPSMYFILVCISDKLS